MYVASWAGRSAAPSAPSSRTMTSRPGDCGSGCQCAVRLSKAMLAARFVVDNDIDVKSTSVGAAARQLAVRTLCRENQRVFYCCRQRWRGWSTRCDASSAAAASCGSSS